MRVNVYHEELTDEAEIVWKVVNTGRKYCGLRIFVKSDPMLHHRPGDDDRSAVTFWFGTLDEAYGALARLTRLVADDWRHKHMTLDATAQPTTKQTAR